MLRKYRQKYCLNIEIVGKEDPSSVNWDEVLCWREIESEKILILSAVKENSLDVLDDKERELNNLKDKNVSDRVEDHGQDTVSYKWDFTEKRKENGSKMLKARLVAQGLRKRVRMKEQIFQSAVAKLLEWFLFQLPLCRGNYILLISLQHSCKVTILKQKFLFGFHQK